MPALPAPPSPLLPQPATNAKIPAGMTLNAAIAFCIFTPKTPTPRPSTEIRFSRWNNANAQKFVRPQREQQEIEAEIRRERRFQSISNITDNFDHEPSVENPEFKSHGSPSSPSRPSIPGKASKYSKNPENRRNENAHPAFRKIPKVFKRIPKEDAEISVGNHGVQYLVSNAPFEFQYSYTETPKVKPLALREPPITPFGPATMPRPWTGRKPLPASKKKRPEFDSFRLPPPHKKGVKPVQAPGPLIAGSGPKYVKSREEILGEPLTEEEIKSLVEGCLKTKRQLNMGRDGLTHNMLDNIHAHWKRRRVCKIKCKGVCTVDMDNVRQQLEEKTGGKIIYSRGGVIFLFRGRNYNYKTCPKFPLMLWKPITPVYPRLIHRVPEGLTLEEATEMRKKGRKLPPICKLGKNGVYSDLVKNVKEAFEECDLVRINCQGMNSSDYKKIGAKLKDLVPCVLISFEYEHILMWRGRDWKSSLPQLEHCSGTIESVTGSATANMLNAPDSLLVEPQETAEIGDRERPVCDKFLETPNSSISLGEQDVISEETNNLQIAQRDLSPEEADDLQISERNDELLVSSHACDNGIKIAKSVDSSDSMSTSNESTSITEDLEQLPGCVALSSSTTIHNETAPALEDQQALDQLVSVVGNVNQSVTSSSQTCTEGVLLLWGQAIETGSALVLDDDSLDANVVYEKAVALAKTAPPGPVFRQRIRKVVLQKVEKQGSESLEVEEVVHLPEKRNSDKKSSRVQNRKDFKNDLTDVVPQGSLGVDELAKLLA